MNEGLGRLEKVALYYRMSSDQQEDSIDRQRSQVEPYVKRRGYTVVREFTDEGISGDLWHKRKGFSRMLEEAKAGKFNVIVCDDKDRFGRFDAIDYGEVVAPLRRAGVRVETVAQGPIDWLTLPGRMMDAMVQEFKAAEQKATSRRVMTEHLRRVKQGSVLGGPAPMGYLKVVEPERRRRFVLGDPVQVAAVRLMFDLYANTDTSVGGVVSELISRGISAPRGGTWKRGSVVKILRNPVYVGDLVWNRVHAGGFSQLKGGEVHTSDLRSKGYQHDRSEWIVVADQHEPLIDRETFERVQMKLKLNQGRTTPVKARGAFALLSLLVCSHCGYRMIGSTLKGRLTYRCGGNSTLAGYCHSNRIHEKPLIGLVADKLQQTFLHPTHLAELRAEVRRQEEADRDPSALQDLRRQIATLEKNITTGTRKLALVSEDMISGVEEQIRQWKAQRDVVAAALERATSQSQVRNLEGRIAAVERLLMNLRGAIQRGTPAEVRELMQEVVLRIELRFRHVPKGAKYWSIPDGGVIYLRTNDGESGGGQGNGDGGGSGGDVSLSPTPRGRPATSRPAARRLPGPRPDSGAGGPPPSSTAARGST